MTDPIRAALERLIARIEETHNPDDPVPAWFDAARVALAEQQGRGPAVLESREPASVADPDDPIQEALNKLEEYDQANPYHDCRDLIAAARVALARWRLSAAPPAPLVDLAAKLIAESQPISPEFAATLSPDVLWGLYEDSAQPATPLEVKGASDEELESVARAAEIQDMREQGGLSANDANGIQAQLQRQRLAGLRAVFNLDRQPTPPAEGEVAELVAILTGITERTELHPVFIERFITRAAELLQQQQAEINRLRAQQAPVPVSDETWRDGWLNSDGECWWCPPEGPAYWQMANPAMVYGGWVLPAHALPMPQGEVEK